MWSHLQAESKKQQSNLIKREIRFVVTGCVCGGGGLSSNKIQVSSFKINKYWRCHVQHNDINMTVNTVMYIF